MINVQAERKKDNILNDLFLFQVSLVVMVVTEQKYVIMLRKNCKGLIENIFIVFRENLADQDLMDR